MHFEGLTAEEARAFAEKWLSMRYRKLSSIRSAAESVLGGRQ